MATPSPRNSIRIARGLYADLLASIADQGIGELCYGTDHDKFYTPDGQGGLAEVGRGTAIATLGQVGDVDLTGLQNGQVLKWNGSSWSPAEDVAPVTSVAGKVGVVTLVKADITDLDESDYATAAQGALADTALQPGDAFSGDYNDLTNQPSIPAALPDLTDVVSPLLVSDGEVLRYRSSNSRFEPGVVVDPSGATMTGTLGTTERTITAGAFNLATGNHWTC
ncbi:MAG: hypothetical protein GY917_04445, partial [Planctomycetaceae bacterium]|nr:hypothetical protein [Planctomycetaceae bacterium]